MSPNDRSSQGGVVGMRPSAAGNGLVATFSSATSTGQSAVAQEGSVPPERPHAPPTIDEARRAADLLSDVLQKASRIEAAVEQLVARDDSLAQANQRLTKYEEDFVTRSYLEPWTRKLAFVHRRLNEQLSLLERQTATLPPHSRQRGLLRWFHRSLEAFRVELESILSDFGVEIFVNTSPQFARSCQKAVEKLKAPNPEQVGQIARCISPGFRFGDRILVAERVAVFTADGTVPENQQKEAMR